MFDVILRGVPYSTGSRDMVLARGVERSEADSLTAEYRATGWTVDVVLSGRAADAHVPALRMLDLPPDVDEGAREALLVAFRDWHDPNDRWEIVGVRDSDLALRVRYVPKDVPKRSVFHARRCVPLTDAAVEFVEAIKADREQRGES